MATTVINTCDRCGIDDFRQEVIFIEVWCGAGTVPRQWCRKCCVEVGVVELHDAQREKILGTPAPAPFSFEEILHEWLSVKKSTFRNKASE